MPIYQLLGGSQPSVFTYATGGYYVEGAPLSRLLVHMNLTAGKVLQAYEGTFQVL